ncbi:MAG TPA: ATP-binding protein, partial [Chloroflexota bacterium]|nr:ATP-binding protein [Chloroflexota bacterium]
AAEQETIFERFHGRGHTQGAGLGLAIVRAIVARHHGRVWVESREGEGAAFHMTLPRPETEGKPA